MDREMTSTEICCWRMLTCLSNLC